VQRLCYDCEFLIRRRIFVTNADKLDDASIGTRSVRLVE
jgi:hypothetical protein